MIRAICFDLDGVYFTPVGKASFLKALVTEFGGDEQAAKTFMTSSAEMRLLVAGNITPDAFFDSLRASTGITASNKTLIERWVKDYEIDLSVKNFVQKIKRAGYKTCVCTNNNAIRLPALEERFKFYQDFDVIVSSHEVGYTKPDKEIFEILINRLGIKPYELFYADDNPERLTGAQTLGIVTSVYTNFSDFIHELQRHGIIV